MLGPTGRTVAANLLRLRKERGLSTTGLAAALKDAGRSIPATGITRIEKGQRRVDVDDLMALAVVLGVNPAALLMPPVPEGTVELTAAGKVDAQAAWQWAKGIRPLCIPENDDGTAHADFQRHALPLGMRDYQIPSF